MSSMRTDAGSFVLLLGWRSCLPMLHAGTALSPRPPGPGHCLSQKNNTAKHDTCSRLHGKKIVSIWWAWPKEEIGLIIFFPSLLHLCYCGWSLHCVSSQLRKDLASCESSAFCSKDCSLHTQRKESFFYLDKISENFLNCRLLSLLKNLF